MGRKHARKQKKQDIESDKLQRIFRRVAEVGRFDPARYCMQPTEIPADSRPVDIQQMNGHITRFLRQSSPCYFFVSGGGVEYQSERRGPDRYTDSFKVSLRQFVLRRTSVGSIYFEGRGGQGEVYFPSDTDGILAFYDSSMYPYAASLEFREKTPDGEAPARPSLKVFVKPGESIYVIDATWREKPKRARA
jgi:hypothetical protein